MIWWMAVFGVASVVGAGYLIFDGAQTAEWIGYTRGDGGFQWETATGDLAIGVLGIMSYWFRGHFWLATIVVGTIRYVGNAAGHIYYSVVHHNPTPNNFGILLSADILLSIVMWALYTLSRRNNGDAVPKSVARPAGGQPRQHRPRVQS